MTDHTYSALREYRKRIAAMLNDPECVGDLLSLGIALLDYAVLRRRDEKTFESYAKRAWGDAARYRLHDVLRKDVRRYDALKDAEASGPARTCGAPMVQRQGPCGRSGSRRTMLTDPSTGRKQWIAACRRHEDWFTERVRLNRLANDEAEAIADATRPAANAGGVLARHIPEIDWPAVWVGLEPGWTPPPEAEPEVVPVAPRLRLVLGGAS